MEREAPAEILHPVDLQKKIDTLGAAYTQAVSVLESNGLLRDLCRRAISTVLSKPLPSYEEASEKAVLALDEAIVAFEGLGALSAQWIRPGQRLRFGQRLSDLVFSITSLQRDLYDQQMPCQLQGDMEPLRKLLCTLESSN